MLGKSRQQKKHEFLYFEMPHGKSRTFAIRMGDWKTIKPEPNAEVELYNLKNDLAETKNVAAENPEIMRQVKKILAAEHTDERKYPAEKPAVGVKDYVR